jgi:hypothetical protein
MNVAASLFPQREYLSHALLWDQLCMVGQFCANLPMQNPEFSGWLLARDKDTIIRSIFVIE